MDPLTGKAEKLTSHGKAGAFLFEKAGTLLCQKPGKKPGTTDYEYLELDTGKTEPAFTLPWPVNKLEKLCGDLYLVNADIDTNYPEEERKAEEDYIKIGELPFWDNGVGYVSGHRDTLYLYNKATGERKRITEEKFALGSTAVSADGKTVWYTGAAYTQMKLEKSGLYELDVPTGKVQELLPQDRMRIGQIKCAGGELYVAASFCDKMGGTEKNDWYLLKGGKLEKILDNDFTIGCNISTDCRYGSWKSTRASSSTSPPRPRPASPSCWDRMVPWRCSSPSMEQWMALPSAATPSSSPP